jgi:hypothetical protein
MKFRTNVCKEPQHGQILRADDFVKVIYENIIVKIDILYTNSFFLCCLRTDRGAVQQKLPSRGCDGRDM